MKMQTAEEIEQEAQEQEAQIDATRKQVKAEVLNAIGLLQSHSLTVGFAESCTAGLLSSFFGEVTGVSSVFIGSIVCYDNKVKQKFLNVSEETLINFGAVSFQTAKKMAEEAAVGLEVSVAVSVTGIAGPTGGSSSKPLGTVFIAVAGLKSDTQIFEHHFKGVRKGIQLQACVEAIKHLNDFIRKNKT